MINDPSSLFALLFFVATIGLLVLVMPIVILCWSQVEPQLVGLMTGDLPPSEDDYASQAVLPKLMKSFSNLAEETKAKKPAARRKPAAKAKTKAKAATSSARSKASTGTKTVKTKKVAATRAKPASTKSKTASTAPPKKKPASKKKTANAKRRTPAGAKRDPILGIIFLKKPEEIDDLKQIKGVAKVIEAKLQGAGIYTFRQIVEWDDAAVDAFSETLSFKGRIRNEGWQEQCAKLHEDKYGAKI